MCKPESESKPSEAEIIEVTLVTRVEKESSLPAQAATVDAISTVLKTTELKKEIDFIAGLESQELDRGPTFDLAPQSNSGSGNKSSTCNTCKPVRQGWHEHDVTETHIKALTSARVGEQVQTAMQDGRKGMELTGQFLADRNHIRGRRFAARSERARRSNLCFVLYLWSRLFRATVEDWSKAREGTGLGRRKQRYCGIIPLRPGLGGEAEANAREHAARRDARL